jgi:hypothetical protein
MNELQKIVIGLLGLSHPEIYRSRMLSAEPAQSLVESSDLKRTDGSGPTPAATALRGVKFAFAALLAGARSIPLGDNGRITRELGEYGTHLKGC